MKSRDLEALNGECGVKKVYAKERRNSGGALFQISTAALRPRNLRLIVILYFECTIKWNLSVHSKKKEIMECSLVYS